jgi:hypothetical protein
VHVASLELGIISSARKNEFTHWIVAVQLFVLATIDVVRHDVAAVDATAVALMQRQYPVSAVRNAVQPVAEALRVK